MGRSQTRSDFISRIVIICLFIILFVIIMIPFYAVALSSFKPGESLVRYGLNLSLDFEIMSFDNFIFLFTGEHDYFVWFWNSMILTIVQVVLTLFVSAFVAYGFAAYH
ncbi:arabinose transporter permease, partial [Clostridioides difficile]